MQRSYVWLDTTADHFVSYSTVFYSNFFSFAMSSIMHTHILWGVGLHMIEAGVSVVQIADYESRYILSKLYTHLYKMNHMPRASTAVCLCLYVDWKWNTYEYHEKVRVLGQCLCVINTYIIELEVTPHIAWHVSVDIDELYLSLDNSPIMFRFQYQWAET